MRVIRELFEINRWIPVSREFEPHQRPALFPWARNFTLIA